MDARAIATGANRRLNLLSQKILIAAFGFYPEQHGVAQVAYQQAIGLHQLGYDITVITRGASQINHPFKVVFVDEKVDYQLFLKSSEAEVIFFHGWHNWVSDWAIPVLPLKGKAVLVSHGTNFNVRLGGLKGWIWWLRNRAEALGFRKKMTRFDHFVFLSPKLDQQRMSDVVLAKKLKMSNYSIIPNGARPTFYKESPLNFRAKNNIKSSKMLLCVSNYQPTKGQRELVDWFMDLGLIDTALVLIGSEFNAFSDQLKKQVGEHLGKTIFLFEKLSEDELQVAYYEATIFLSATYTEVQPLMLLDAMSVGLPFLCRDVGAVSELEGGVCFKNKADFKKKLQWLLKGSLLRELLGKTGKKTALKKHNWQRIARQYHNLIQNSLIQDS
jgi:glycosyltransferase involved in cell wall biosynthesis